jgi:hypothetical protein
MKLAERTGLEPATPGVTGRYSNQLNYRSNLRGAGLYRATFRDATQLWRWVSGAGLRAPQRDFSGQYI